MVDELKRRELQDARRIRQQVIALQNQRDDLLAFAGVLDAKLAGIARVAGVSDAVVCTACLLHRKPTTRPRTGKAGAGNDQNWAASSTPSSPP